MNQLVNRPDPARLLEAFAESDRCDKAFATLVGSLQGLVFTSALRRTGNPQLAEEIAQNVFAIMARKAESLRKHPCLTAWALKTTQLQSATAMRGAMRGERRRQRKMAAITGETRARPSPTSNAMDDQSTWKDAVPFLDEALDRLPPKDQKVILQRFYEGKKFKEIASQTGQTESACKKRVQRALQKLSSMLTSRAVTLSGTAVASLLGAEFARAVPAHTAAALAPNALAASSPIFTTTLLTNTLQTMSTFKTTTITAGVVLALAAIPISQQLAEGSRIRAELQGAKALASSTVEARPVRRALSDRKRAMPSLTASGILASLDAPTDSHGIFRDLLSAAYHEPLEAMMASYRISMMSTDEFKRLLVDLRTFPCPEYSKHLYLESPILDNGPNLPHRDRLEILVASGGEKSVEALQNWAESEPEAARDWYLEKRASGELDPGLSSAMHRQMLTDLIRGLTHASPEMALDLYREMPREEMDSQIVNKLGRDLAEYLMKTGDESFLSQMLEYHREEDRTKALEGVFWKFASLGEYDAGLAWIDKYHPNPEERVHYFGEMFNDVIVYQSPDILEWLGTTATEREGPEIVGRVIAVNQGRRSEAKEWLERQSPGAMRDHGYAGLVEHLLHFREFEEALVYTEQIDDAALRVGSEQLAAQRWLARDREEAEEALPVALRDQGYAGLVESRLEAGLFKKALEDAGRIDDPSLRGTSRQMIGRQWLEHDRAEAQQGLPAELRQQLQNQ